MYEVQQQTEYQWEPMVDGEFETEAEAIAGLESLEHDLGWRDMRVVRQILAEDGGILDREVVMVGQTSDSDEGE